MTTHDENTTAGAALDSLEAEEAERLVDRMSRLIHKQSTMTRGDADDLAWSLLRLIVPSTGAALLRAARVDAVRDFCEAQIAHDAGKAGDGLTDRAWAAQSVLNILNGTTDDQLMKG